MQTLSWRHQGWLRGSSKLPVLCQHTAITTPQLEVFSHSLWAPSPRLTSSRVHNSCVTTASNQAHPPSPGTAGQSASGLLQLPELSDPNNLQPIWQDNVLPACLTAWQDLLHSTEQLQELQTQHHLPADALAQFLQQLDALLGTCQQVLLVAALLKDRHQSQDWRAAAAAVYVEARDLERELCSDVCLQQGLLLCLDLLQQHSRRCQQQQQQQQQQQRPGPARPAAQPHSRQVQPAPCTGSSSRTSSDGNEGSLLLLARSLLRHMQLESLTPAAAAAGAPGSDILTLQEQQALMSGLLAEHKVLVTRMQAVLLDPAAAPVVETDASSAAVLLEPLQANPDAAAAAARVAPGTAVLPASNTELRLDLQLVTLLLQLHPDAAVRHEVYSAGVLQRLDQLMSLWAQLAEVRRKIGRMHGFTSYAEYVLQHTTVTHPSSASNFCLELAALLKPHAQHAVQQQLQQLQQLQQHVSGRAQQPWAACPEGSLSGGDLEYLVHQGHTSELSLQDLQELQPYLRLDSVLSGLDQVLQLMLGLSLTPRQARSGEVWHDKVRVLELREMPALTQRASSSCDRDSISVPVSSSDSVQEEDLLGVVYLDPSAAYGAQLLLYGREYPVLGWPCSTVRRVQARPAGAAAAAAAAASAAADVAWGPAHAAHSAAAAAAAGSGRAASGGQAPGSTGVVPAVAVGLQSAGVLTGGYQQLALGLWELCHEMGHAINFILSSRRGSSRCGPATASAAAEQDILSSKSARQDLEHRAAGEAQHVAAHAALYHMHASWLPLELVELPSTLLEVLVLEPSALQLLCPHTTTRQHLPPPLAAKLAVFMRSTHYHPAQYQSVVLAMMFDIEAAALSSKQIGRHAACHLWRSIMQELGSLAHVDCTLQQLSVMPRMLAASGQGFGYAVAWSCAQLLQPLLLSHLHQAAALKAHPKETFATVEDCPATQEQAAQRQAWRQLLASGFDLVCTEELGAILQRLRQRVKQREGMPVDHPCLCLGSAQVEGLLQSIWHM